MAEIKINFTDKLEKQETKLPRAQYARIAARLLDIGVENATIIPCLFASRANDGFAALENGCIIRADDELIGVEQDLVKTFNFKKQK